VARNTVHHRSALWNAARCGVLLTMVDEQRTKLERAGADMIRAHVQSHGGRAKQYLGAVPHRVANVCLAADYGSFLSHRLSFFPGSAPTQAEPNR